MNYPYTPYFYLVALILCVSNILNAQIVEVPFKDRVQAARHIVIAEMESQHPYWDDAKHNIYTLNVLKVTAYLKGHDSQKYISVISEGGIVDDKMQVTYPSLNLNKGTRYFLMLQSDNTNLHNSGYRDLHPNVKQCLPVTIVQAALPYYDGHYIDALDLPPTNEVKLLSKVKAMINTSALTPKGDIYNAIKYEVPQRLNVVQPIATIEDGTGIVPPQGFIAGTIVQDNELIINGSGFGSNPGNVDFPNSNDGGASLIPVPSGTVSSDVISWSDTEIRVKIPSGAGSGTMRVRNSSGSVVGTTAITIRYNINGILSDLAGFSEMVRQRVELADRNGNGGYTFDYNNTVAGGDGTTFAANAAAQAAFERALDSWRTNTDINWVDDNSGSSAGLANDDVNIVLWANLGGSTLGISTLRYSGNGGGPCTQFDTYWYLDETDLRFDIRNNWNFGPGASSSGENDFESTALHELGHSHGLGHVNAPGEVMHYITNGGDMRTLSADDIAGGSFKVNHSIQNKCVHDNGFSVPDPMIPYSSIAMPVELLSFNATKSDSRVMLSWQTSAEINSGFFAIERSIDGRNFTQIGMVRAAGYSTTEISYTFNDYEIGTSSIFYYRLRIVDTNGNYEYSRIQAVRFELTSENNFIVYPTVLKDRRLNYSFTATQAGNHTIEVLNIWGQPVSISTYAMEEGEYNGSLNMYSLSAGSYFVRIRSMENGEISDTKRFVVQ